MPSGSFDMRYAAAAIAGMALFGAALFAESVDESLVSGGASETANDPREAPLAIEARSEVMTPTPAPPPGAVQVEAGEEDLIDSAEGLDPSGIDPSGADPEPEPQRPALPPEQLGQPTAFIESATEE